MAPRSEEWPALPLDEWEPTYQNLHMVSQIAGKIVLAATPLVNHWWNVTFEVNARGLASRLLELDGQAFQLHLDLHDHVLRIERCDGARRSIALGGSVKTIYGDVMKALDALDLPVRIWTKPVEVADPIPFDRDDVHATYVPEHAYRFWDVLRRVASVFAEFRARFTGKTSPVHFFWGSFDLAVTRFSGRLAPPPEGADRITRLGYDSELTSVGFWPGGTWLGGTRVEEPIFYAYAYPQPRGFGDEPVGPRAAHYDARLGEFVLPYEAVRRSSDPALAILEFAQATYEAGARLQGWPMEQLELTG